MLEMYQNLSANLDLNSTSRSAFKFKITNIYIEFNILIIIFEDIQMYFIKKNYNLNFKKNFKKREIVSFILSFLMIKMAKKIIQFHYEKNCFSDELILFQFKICYFFGSLNENPFCSNCH